MPWKVRGPVPSLANSPVGVLCCPAQPRPAVRRPDPTRPLYVRVLDSTSLHNFALGDKLYSCRIQNPAHITEDRREAARGGHGGAARRGEDGQGGTSTGRFAQNTNDPLARQTIKGNPPGRVPGSTNKRIPIKTDGGTKTAVDQRFIRVTKGALRSWLLTNAGAHLPL